jgi:hypothetical protein
MSDLKDKFPIKDTKNSNFFETWEWHFNREKMEDKYGALRSVSGQGEAISLGDEDEGSDH